MNKVQLNVTFHKLFKLNQCTMYVLGGTNISINFIKICVNINYESGLIEFEFSHRGLRGLWRSPKL